LALIGVDSVAAAVPVAGEVIIAGTAVFFAGEWVAGHWSDITHWADDAGHVASSVYHDATRLVNSTVTEGEHLVSAGLHEAGTLLSDLNPFG
jgi:hypothetical protein